MGFYRLNRWFVSISVDFVSSSLKHRTNSSLHPIMTCIRDIFMFPSCVVHSDLHGDLVLFPLPLSTLHSHCSRWLSLSLCCCFVVKLEPAVSVSSSVQVPEAPQPQGLVQQVQQFFLWRPPHPPSWSLYLEFKTCDPSNSPFSFFSTSFP